MKQRLLVVVGALVFATASATLAFGEPVEKEQLMNEFRMKEALDLAAKLNVFRLSAGFDVDRALAVWAGPAFMEKWRSEVAGGFAQKETKDQLRDFFSSAVLMLGRVQDGKAVALLYNPWADGLLLLAVESGSSHLVLTDFQFVAGESWRREKPASADEFLALYTAKEPLVLALARRYAAVEQRFNQEYPLGAPFEFLPASVKADVDVNASELPPVVIRLAYRQRMFTMLKSQEGLEALPVVQHLRKALAAPDKAALAAYLSPEQNATMLDSVVQLPPVLLKNLSPNHFSKDATSALVALVNADMPRWIVAVRIVKKDAASPAVTLEAFDLGISAKLLKDLDSAPKSEGSQP